MHLATVVHRQAQEEEGDRKTLQSKIKPQIAVSSSKCQKYYTQELLLLLLWLWFLPLWIVHLWKNPGQNLGISGKYIKYLIAPFIAFYSPRTELFIKSCLLFALHSVFSTWNHCHNHFMRQGGGGHQHNTNIVCNLMGK